MHVHVHMLAAVATASTLSLQNQAMISDLLAKHAIKQIFA